jgi:hypothetical protein
MGRKPSAGSDRKHLFDKSLHYKIKKFGKLEKKFKALFRFFDEKVSESIRNLMLRWFVQILFQAVVIPSLNRASCIVG